MRSLLSPAIRWIVAGRGAPQGTGFGGGSAGAPPPLAAPGPVGCLVHVGPMVLGVLLALEATVGPVVAAANSPTANASSGAVSVGGPRATW